MKTCITCGVAKPEADFHQKKDAADGRYPHCKVCRKAKDEVYLEQPITIGTGKLITSGKTVHGFETNFPEQLSLGDFIILMELEGDRLVEKERRKVNMVLSARSCGIEEAFSEDLIDKSEYYVQRKPKLRERVKPV